VWVVLLNAHSRQRASPHTALNELSPALWRFAFCLKDSPDFFPFCDNQGVILITVGLNVCKSLDSLFSPTNLGQPTWRTRKEWQASHQENSRNELNAPGCAERSGSFNERAAVTGEEHDEDTPFDGKLLDNDDASTSVLLGDLGEVDGDLGRGDTDTDAVKDSSCNQLAEILAGNLDGCSNKPPNCRISALAQLFK
jgi:hypothetical protein